jgi:Protein of unknown function (DUF2786)
VPDVSAPPSAVNGDKIADRIRKLLALAGNNPSEAEAAAAMEPAAALMAEHNLTMMKVETSDEAQRIETHYDGQRPRQTWARTIWNAVATLNFCLYYYQTPRPPRVGDRHSVIGTRVNVVSTQIMAQYLVETVERLARECPDIHAMHDHHAFKLGCARRLAERIRHLRESRVNVETTKTPTGSQPLTPIGSPSPSSNLPALANLYKSNEIANRDLYKQIHGGKLGSGYGATTSRTLAYSHGLAAGDGVGLDPQVARSQRKLASPRSA